MIRGFEDQTHDLTEKEIKKIVPAVRFYLRYRIGYDNAISGNVLLQRLNLSGYKVRPARIRKIINYLVISDVVIRTGYVLIASNKGYFITRNKLEIQKWVLSMTDRIEAMKKRLEAVVNSDAYNYASS